MAEYSDNLRHRVDKKRNEMREVHDDIIHLRTELALLHERMVPVFNKLLANGGQLNEFNVGPFAIDFAKRLDDESAQDL
jgi:hypothetical protein